MWKIVGRADDQVVLSNGEKVCAIIFTFGRCFGPVADLFRVLFVRAFFVTVP